MKNLVEFIRQNGIIAQARGNKVLTVHISHILNNVKQYSQKFPIDMWRVP
jgi:hypothetical protein